MRRKSPWIHYARFDCVLDLRMDDRQGRLVGGLEMNYKGKKISAYKKAELIRIIQIMRDWIPDESEIQRRFDE